MYNVVRNTVKLQTTLRSGVYTLPILLYMVLQSCRICGPVDDQILHGTHV
jgi:hypothetical protein